VTYSWYIFGRLSIGRASFSVGLLSGCVFKKVWRQCHNNLLTKKNLTLKKTPISPILKNHSLFSWQKIIAGDFMHLSYWCHNCITKKTKGSQKYLFNRQKKNAQKHHYLLSFFFFCTKLLIFYNKTSTLRIKIINNNFEKSFFFTFLRFALFV
jgi:hypothetical protein